MFYSLSYYFRLSLLQFRLLFNLEIQSDGVNPGSLPVTKQEFFKFEDQERRFDSQYCGFY